MIPKTIKNPTIIQGFPGVGLVGSIAIEYLIEHLDTTLVGKHYFEEVNASIAIHKGKVIYPLNIYYDKKNNFLLLHSVIATPGLEWKIASIVTDIVSKTKAKEIICLEGVGTTNPGNEPKIYYYSTDKKKTKALDGMSERMEEGIIVGVTPAVMIKSGVDVTAFFADTATGLPDSKAAAKVIETLDKYLNLKIDPNPLLDQAVKFEDKIKQIMKKGAAAQQTLKDNQLSYVG